MNRFRPPHPDQMTPAQRRVHDHIVASRAAASSSVVDDDGRLVGPFGPMATVPSVGEPMQALGAALRFGGDLEPRLRELVILVVAAHWDSRFEWHHHAVEATRLGLAPDAVDAIRAREPIVGLTELERVVVDTARRLVTDADLDDHAYATATRHLGEEGLIEVVFLVGYYAALALQMRVLRIE